jgi:RHS repeat-associated protein
VICGSILPDVAPRTVGDPVDVITGAVTDSVRDLVIAGPFRLEWRRSYSTARLRDRGLGLGWTHTFDHQLRFDLDGLLYVAPGGGSTKFPFLDSETRRGARRGYVLERVEEFYTLQRPDGPALAFEIVGPAKTRLAGMPSPRGPIRLRYDYNGFLTSLTDPARNSLSILHDRARINGLRFRQGANDEATDLAAYTYEDDRLVDVEDGYHHHLKYEYDRAGRMTKRTDRRGYSFHYEYDGEGRCVHSRGDDGLLEVRLEYFPFERRTRVTHGDGGVWEYHYDEAKTVTLIVDPTGATRQFLPRPSDGRIEREIDGAGNEIHYIYDAEARFLGKRDAAGRWIRPPRAHRLPRTPLEYELGRAGARPFMLPTTADRKPELPDEVARLLVSTTDPARGRLVEVRDAQGLLVREELEGRVRRYAYEPNGNLRWCIDFDGGKTEREIGAQNQVTAETDANRLVTRYEYTRGDELAATIDPQQGRTDFQRNVRQEVACVARANAAKDLYLRDGAGRLVEKRDGQGRTLYTLKRGPQGEVLERSFASGGFERFKYDAQLRVVEGETEAGKIELGYAGGHRVADLRDGVGVNRRFLGRDLLELRVLERFVTRYRYSESPDRRDVTVTDPTGRHHRLRDLGDGMVERAFAHGLRETAQYHPQGHCLAKVAHTSSAHWSRSYGYSGEGDVLSVHDSARGTTRYTYDPAHRLLSEELPTGAVRAYQHDNTGNLLQNGANYARFFHDNLLAEANGRRFQHDARQAVETESWHSGCRTFVRDARDQLVRVEVYRLVQGAEGEQYESAGVWTAKYDALNRRVEKNAFGKVTGFYWDSDRLIAEVAPSGELRVYVYADALAMTPFLFVDYASVEAAPESGKVYAILANHLGCPEAIHDAESGWVWTAQIDPYGHAAVDLGADVHQPLRWPGHYFDAELGLHYNRFRTYSPELGRYLEPDPVGRGGGLENVYQYTINPLRTVDVRGLSTSCPIPPKKAPPTEPEAMPDAEDAEGGGLSPDEDFDRGIDASRDAAERAAEAKATLEKDKCYAADGPEADLTMSGWGHEEGDGLTKVAPGDVMDHCDEIGHNLKSHPWDQGEPGQFNASHAEKQQAVARPGEPVGVSNPMCADCQNFFSKQAEALGEPQVVTDPNVTRIFHPDGTVTVVNPDGTEWQDPRFPPRR